MKLKVSEVYRLFGQEYRGRDRSIRGVSTDSRTIKKGDLFIAIKGLNMDGHDFIQDAVKKGASCVIASSGKNGIIVKDTVEAMARLAKYYAAKFRRLKVASITGSNGKTTTKEMLAAILSEAFGKGEVLFSVKSYNNNIGVPLTLFRLSPRHRVAVLEMGMNGRGEIARLASLAGINTAVITNIGTSHIGKLKSMKNIALAKAEIFSGAVRGGTAVLNKGSRFYSLLAESARKAGMKVVDFGTEESAHARVELLKTGGTGTVFSVRTGKGVAVIEMKFKGAHNVMNAAAACLAALSLGAKLRHVKAALSRMKPGGNLRFDEKTKGGIRYIADCYNANPDSYKAGIETLRSLAARSLIIVSGDMLELGSMSEKYHVEIGAMLARLNVKKLFAYGRYGKSLIRGFVSAGGNRKNTAVFSDMKKLKRAVAMAANPGDTVYIKGSRSNKLEEILK